MARSAMLSILGLYNYDNLIFEDMVVPGAVTDETTGVTTEPVELPLLVDLLLMQLAELEVIYPDPDFMRQAISRWSRSRITEWEKLNLTIYLKWNPIHNYDRTEEWTDGEQGSGENQSSDTVTGNGTNTQSVAGFNSTTLVDSGKTVANSSSTREGNGANSYNKTVTRKGSVKGNIGVTTADQMIAQYRETAKFNIYDVIREEFKERFCIMVY